MTQVDTAPEVLHRATADTKVSTPEDAWLTTGRFSAILTLLIFAVFPGVLLGKETFCFRDFSAFSYPVAFFHRECFWRGEIPLWNPYSYCGIPFLAQWNTMVLYPPTLIYLLLPLTWSLPFFCLAHVFWGGLGMFFLAQNWTPSRLGAALAGVLFSFNGLVLNFLMWPSHVATFAWIPWVLWLVPNGWRAGGKRLVLGVLAGSMQMLAGGPETILFTWLILLLLCAGECLEMFFSPKHQDALQIRVCRPRKVLARLTGMALLVALVCAAQLLPFLQLLANSDRDAAAASAGFGWSMPASGWANLLLPLFRTIPWSQGVFFQVQQNWTSSYYAGIATLFLAGIALGRVAGWRVKLLGFLVFASLVLALGDNSFVYRTIREGFPFLGIVRYPVKFVIVTIAVLPLIAAMGFGALVERQRMKASEWCWAAVLLVLLTGLMLFDWKYPLLENTWLPTWENGLTRAGLFFGVIAVIVGISNWTGRRRIVCHFLLLVLVWLDLATHVPNQNPTVAPRVYLPGWARAQLQLDPQLRLGQSRLMLAPQADATLRYHDQPSPEQETLIKRLAFFCNANLLDQVPQTYGFFSIAPREISQLASLPYVYTNLPVEGLLDFIGVSHKTAPGTLCDWQQRPTVMPLVTAGQRPIFADDKRSVQGLLQTNVDLRQIAFLPPEASSNLTTTNPSTARVLQTHFEGGKVKAVIDAPSSTLLTVSQTHYPSWKAYIDGKPARIWRANYAFQAVEVPSGNHEVLLRYEDTYFLIGCALSLFGLLTCLYVWLANPSRV